jgi:RND family efflux transporter MFP subunit
MMASDFSRQTESAGISAIPSRFKRLKLVLVLAVIGFVCVATLGLKSRAARTEEFQRVSKDAAQIRVQVVSPQEAPGSLELQLPGQTQSYYQAPILAQTNGYLKKWYYDIGTKVKAGDIMGEIDTPEVDQRLRQAEANLVQAKAQLDLSTVTFQRFKDLLQRNVVAQQDFDTQRANYLAQQATVNADHAAVRRLQALEDFKLLRAPFDGILTSRNTDIGALITSGSANPLFTVAQVDPLRVYVSVPENFGREVQIGNTADLSFDEFPGRLFPAKVVATSGAIDPSTRTLLTELEVPNPSNELWPGAYTIAHFHLQSSGNSLSIPANTLLFRAGGPSVGVVRDDGKVEIRKVQIGKDLGAQLEIVKGLSSTDQLIVNPSDSLSDGMEVQIEKPGLESSSVAQNS